LNQALLGLKLLLKSFEDIKLCADQILAEMIHAGDNVTFSGPQIY
jgi:hypothetical protein